MQSFVLTLHIIACIILILLVLLQSGKEGMGVIFGGGSSTVFGSSGAGGLLTKLTAFLAALFLITSLTYNILNRPEGAGRSLILDSPAAEQQGTDAAPAPESMGIEIESKDNGGDQTAAPEAGENAASVETESGAPQPGSEAPATQ